MVEFLFFVLMLTLFAIILSVVIRIFVIRPGQIAKIQYFIEDDKLKEALIYVNMRLKRQPNNAVLKYWQAELLWLMDDKEDAVKAFENIELGRLRGTPGYHARALFRLGSWYCDQGSLDRAAEYYETLFAMKPENPEYFHGGALLALKEGDAHKAIRLLGFALEKNPFSSELLLLAGDTYTSLEAYSEAYAAYARLAQLHPDNPKIWLNLAEVSHRGGNTAKAIRFYNKAETFPMPEERFEAAWGLFNIYKDTGEIFQSIQSLSKAIAYAKPEFCPTPSLLGLYYELAELYVAVNEVDKAVQQWEIILKIDPLYKDVSIKYADFSQIRLSDFFKDLLSLNGSRLVESIITFIKGLGLPVENYTINPDGSVDLITAENMGRWRGDNRKTKTLFSFWCSSEPLLTSFVDDLKGRQAAAGAARALIISAGPVLSEARQQLARRSIDFYDTETINQLSTLFHAPQIAEDILEP